MEMFLHFEKCVNTVNAVFKDKLGKSPGLGPGLARRVT